MLPPEIGYEVKINANGLVEHVTGRDFVDVTMAKSDPKMSENYTSKAQLHSERPISSNSLVATEIRGSLHRVLSVMPPNLRTKARPLLIKILSTCPDVDFTNKGQLVYKSQTIPNSNLAQIMTNILNQTNDSSVPGLKELLGSLKRTSNTPSESSSGQQKAKHLYPKKGTKKDMKRLL